MFLESKDAARVRVANQKDNGGTPHREHWLSDREIERRADRQRNAQRREVRETKRGLR